VVEKYFVAPSFLIKKRGGLLLF